jgi:hypothetical protein
MQVKESGETAQTLVGHDYKEVVIGRYEETGTGNAIGWTEGEADRIFTVGNGELDGEDEERQNAFAICKTGERISRYKPFAQKHNEGSVRTLEVTGKLDSLGSWVLTDFFSLTFDVAQIDVLAYDAVGADIASARLVYDASGVGYKLWDGAASSFPIDIDTGAGVIFYADPPNLQIDNAIERQIKLLLTIKLL